MFKNNLNKIKKQLKKAGDLYNKISHDSNDFLVKVMKESGVSSIKFDSNRPCIHIIADDFNNDENNIIECYNIKQLYIIDDNIYISRSGDEYDDYKLIDIWIIEGYEDELISLLEQSLNYLEEL